MTFNETLAQHNLKVTRDITTTLQVNLGLACDLACRHCHLEAGPDRTEMMNAETVEAVIACAARLGFETIDLTGGAPELNQHLATVVEQLAPLTKRLIVRTNLVALARPAASWLPELYARHGVVLIASLPAINQGQTDAQRGGGVWEQSIATLKQLNKLGYGQPGSGLELDLAANPSGAFLTAGQPQTELRFRQELQRRHAITFTRLLAFANVPLGRFRHWLERSGNMSEYLGKLQQSFNPATLAGLMCCSQLSVRWDGYLYDCDFNLAADLPLGKKRLHITDLHAHPLSGTLVNTGEHCFACTAGSGFSCGGSIVPTK